ncbi:MAG: PRC-barrel domain containing protein [Deltaproteobacteria bacterium]|nr:MAG: PRC-barrel domain containing protein [Deltaproteobacteria bacterium]
MKTKRFIVAVAVLSLALWGGLSFAQTTVQGGYQVKAMDAFQADWLIGHLVYSPVYLGDLGQITDLLIDRCDGRVAFVVLSDTPGFHSESIAVPFGALERTGENTFLVRFGEDVPVATRSLNFQGDRFAQYLVMNRSTIGMKAIPATIDPVWADSVYKVYGVTPYWTAGNTSRPEIVFYRMSGRTDDLGIGYPDGRLASIGMAPYWKTCGGSECGAEAMNFEGTVSPPLPSDAKPGECYASFFVPSRCETLTEKVMTRAASERVETIPAKYEVVEEKVMVKPASRMTEEVSAEYKTVEEKVLVEPAHTEWRPGRGAVEKMDPATGKIMCLVEIAANYETVKKQVLVTPATVREVEIPAQYEMQKVTKMTEPAQEKHIQIPAEYQTVTRTQKVADGYTEWRKVEGCQPNQK